MYILLGIREFNGAGIFRMMFDYSSNFPYLRIYNVTVCEELNTFKNHLDYHSNLPKMKVEYFMIANPIMIKTEVIRRYCGKESDGKFLAYMIDELFEVTKQLSEGKRGIRVD